MTTQKIDIPGGANLTITAAGPVSIEYDAPVEESRIKIRDMRPPASINGRHRGQDIITLGEVPIGSFAEVFRMSGPSRPSIVRRVKWASDDTEMPVLETDSLGRVFVSYSEHHAGTVYAGPLDADTKCILVKAHLVIEKETSDD